MKHTNYNCALVLELPDTRSLFDKFLKFSNCPVYEMLLHWSKYATQFYRLQRVKHFA